MYTATLTRPVSTKTIWLGRIVSAIPALFLIFDAGIKVVRLAPAVEATVNLGYPEQVVFGLGLVQLACLAVYLTPRTTVIGAILLTGYLGGAIATHVRIGSPIFSLIFPIMLGALLWGGLVLRHDRLRALLLPSRASV